MPQVNGATYQTFSNRATDLLNRFRPAPSAGQQTVPTFASKTYQTGSQILDTGRKFSEGVLHIVIGCLFGIGSGIATTLAKDNTAIDIISKLGLFGAAILFVQGSWKLIKNFGGNVTKIVVQDPAVVVSDQLLSITTKAAYSKVKEIDKAYQEPQSKTPSRIASYDKTDAINLRDRAFKLFDNYKASVEHLRPKLDIVDRKEGQSVAITNIADIPKSLLDVQYENAILASYVIASRSQPYENDELCKKVAGVLEPNGISEANADLFPDHFNAVYTNARLYDEYQRRDNDSVSVNGVFKLPLGIDKSEDIPGIVNGGTSPQRTALIEHLKHIQNTRNNLMVLNKVISYINENLNTTDANKKRELNLLRAALVAGFRLKGDESAINNSLSDILRGVDTGTKLTGLTKKIEQFNEQYTKLDAGVLSNVGSVLSKEPKPTDEVFISDLGLCELKAATI